MKGAMRWAPLAAFAALAMAFVIGLFLPDRESLPSRLIGQPAPAFSLPLLQGEGVMTAADLASGDGPTVFNVFASWCAPCRVEHPALMALKDQGYRIIGMAYKDAPGNVTAFLRDLGNPYASVALDANGRAGIEWGVAGVPETFIVNAKGVVTYKHVGPINPGELERKIIPALEAAK